MSRFLKSRSPSPAPRSSYIPVIKVRSPSPKSGSPSKSRSPPKSRSPSPERRDRRPTQPTPDLSEIERSGPYKFPKSAHELFMPLERLHKGLDGEEFLCLQRVSPQDMQSLGETYGEYGKVSIDRRKCLTVVKVLQRSIKTPFVGIQECNELAIAKHIGSSKHHLTKEERRQTGAANVCDIKGWFWDPEHRPWCSWYPMVFEPGCTWHYMMDAFKLPDCLVAHVILEVCHAVKWLHSIRVLHNELDSRNVMFGPGGEFPKITLIDFGAATLWTKEGARFDCMRLLSIGMQWISNTRFARTEVGDLEKLIRYVDLEPEDRYGGTDEGFALGVKMDELYNTPRENGIISMGVVCDEVVPLAIKARETETRGELPAHVRMGMHKQMMSDEQLVLWILSEGMPVELL